MNINGKYPFENGELRVTEAVANQISNILTRFYSCDLEWVEVEKNRPEVDSDTSLAKSVTKGAPVESTPAATANVHAKPADVPPSTIQASVADGKVAAVAAAAETKKA